MNALVYLFGPPGAGKSTLMRALTARCQRTTATGHPVPHEVLHHPERGVVAIELGLTGATRAAHPGTDALGRHIGPIVRAALPDWSDHLVLGEGYRLTNRPFFAAARHTHQTTAVHLRPSPGVAAARCAHRNSTHPATFTKAVFTRSERLAAHLEAAGVRVVELPADLPTPTLADRLRAAVPQLEVLT